MQQEPFQKLLHIMNDLREKCPWDKKQTLQSLKTLTIEETYELVDALENEDMNAIKEELGDLLLHIVFYSKIGQENKAFDINKVINDLCEKLINRHPHIYGDVKVETEEEVKTNWEKIKLKEGKKSVLEGVPKSLPALVKAFRVQEKAAQVGFDWSDVKGVYEKVKEEISELEESVRVPLDKENIEEELGDVFFSLVNYARFLKIDPETALSKSNQKFIKRFQLMEAMAAGQNLKSLSEMNLEEMDHLWELAKKDIANEGATK